MLEYESLSENEQDQLLKTETPRIETRLGDGPDDLVLIEGPLTPEEEADFYRRTNNIVGFGAAGITRMPAAGQKTRNLRLRCQTQTKEVRTTQPAMGAGV
jgi:hypothetical protein